MTADELDTLLPQTQCTRCGYDGCLPYAQALSRGEAEINRCPPGGAETITALAARLQRPVLPLDPECGVDAPPPVAFIDESRCIGCAKCLPPCPVDAIVGAARKLHTVITERCTGCELCVAPCPVDCIVLLPRNSEDARHQLPSSAANRARYVAHVQRREARQTRQAALLTERKRAASAGG
jgi:electron transport complex protein RnfB